MNKQTSLGGAVGILTYHRAQNDGSVLQAACLARLIAQRAKRTVKIVNYLPLPTSKFGVDFLKSCKHFLQTLRTPRLRFLQEIVPFTRPMLRMTRDDLARLLKEEGISRLVIGSDTVWDGKNREFSRCSFKPTLASLKELEHVDVSYFSASADPSYEDGLSRSDAATLVNAIDSSRFCSFRDQPTLQMLQKFGVAEERVQYTPDPTLLAWPEDLVAPPAQTSEQLVGLQLNDPRITQAIADELYRLSIPHVNVYAMPELNAPRSEGSAGFRRGIMARQRLSALITDRFHGAIIFTKVNQFRSRPLLVIEDTHKWENRKGKLSDLFERMKAASIIHRTSPTGARDSARDLVDALMETPAALRTHQLAARMNELVASSDPAVHAFLDQLSS